MAESRFDQVTALVSAHVGRMSLGIMEPEQVAQAIRPEDQHYPRTAAVTFENTHNRHGGIAWPLRALQAASQQARDSGIAVHIDGARIFNAAIAVRADVKDLAAPR